MRIVAGDWRGRALVAPPGATTRPTADRVRQALFDMLIHAPWAGRECLEGAVVLDLFAGTGGLGLEALSRGAKSCIFVEKDRDALIALRANIAACKATERCTVIGGDAMTVVVRGAANLIFLDPPYGLDLTPRALERLRAAGAIAPGALIVAETGRGDTSPHPEPLDQRRHGKATLTIWREN